MEFTFDGNVYVSVVNTEKSNAFDADKLVKKALDLSKVLPSNFVWSEDSSNSNVIIEVTKTHATNLLCEVGNEKINLDIAAILICKNTDITDSNTLNKFGLEQFGKIKWNSYTDDQKKSLIVDLIKESEHSILKDTGLFELVQAIKSHVDEKNIYNSHVCKLNEDNSTIVSCVKYLNDLIMYFKDNLDFDVVKEIFYTNKEQTHANTNILMLDVFLNDTMIGDNEIDINTDLLNFIYETRLVNCLFYNCISGVDSTPVVYGNYINSLVDDAFSEDLTTILDKVPPELLPCCGMTTDSTKLVRLFSTLDYKYLCVPKSKNKYEQLIMLLTESDVLSNKTKYAVMFQLESIKLLTATLYEYYQKLRNAFKLDYGLNFDNKFIRNVTQLIKEIRNGDINDLQIPVEVPILAIHDEDTQNKKKKQICDYEQEVEYEEPPVKHKTKVKSNVKK